MEMRTALTAQFELTATWLETTSRRSDAGDPRVRHTSSKYDERPATRVTTAVRHSRRAAHEQPPDRRRRAALPPPGPCSQSWIVDRTQKIRIQAAGQCRDEGEDQGSPRGVHDGCTCHRYGCSGRPAREVVRRVARLDRIQGSPCRVGALQRRRTRATRDTREPARPPERCRFTRRDGSRQSLPHDRLDELSIGLGPKASSANDRGCHKDDPGSGSFLRDSSPLRPAD